MKTKTQSTSEGEKFSFPEGESLMKAVEAKVDKQEYVDMMMQKSNKKDVEQVLKWITLLHKQIKHVAVLQTELARVMSSRDTEQQKINKYQFLVQQNEKVSQWIDRFDPESVNFENGLFGEKEDEEERYMDLDIQALELFQKQVKEH